MAVLKSIAFFCVRAFLLMVIGAVVLTSKAEWPVPPRVEEWGDFDDVVAECYNSLTNQFIWIYPPGSYWIGLPYGRYLFAPDDEIADVTNLVIATQLYGIPVWQVKIIETADVSRVWLYSGDGSDYFRTNDAPDIVDMEQWVEEAYIVSPPAYLTTAERAQWYADRSRERFGFTFTFGHDAAGRRTILAYPGGVVAANCAYAGIPDHGLKCNLCLENEKKEACQ